MDHCFHAMSHPDTQSDTISLYLSGEIKLNQFSQLLLKRVCHSNCVYKMQAETSLSSLGQR